MSKSELCDALLRLASRRQQQRKIKLLDSQQALDLWVVAAHEERMELARSENTYLKQMLKAYREKSPLKIAA